MKTIVEYKLDKVSTNMLITPPWLVDSGYYCDGKTYVGTIEDSANYYIPNTLRIMTKDEVVSRVLEIQRAPGLDVYTDLEGNMLNDEELTIEVIQTIESWDEVTAPEE